MNSLFFEQVQEFEAVYNFTIRGIDTHLRDDEPNPDLIMQALVALDKQLLQIIREQGK